MGGGGELSKVHSRCGANFQKSILGGMEVATTVISVFVATSWSGCFWLPIFEKFTSGFIINFMRFMNK